MLEPAIVRAMSGSVVYKKINASPRRVPTAGTILARGV